MSYWSDTLKDILREPPLVAGCDIFDDSCADSDADF